MAIIKGFLDPFWETGTEGVYWSLNDPFLPGYDALNVIEDGDKLTVIDDEDKVIWTGIIDLEYESNKVPYPMNPQYSQQAVLNFYVHGLQRNLDPEFWAKMFFEGKRAYLEIENKKVRKHVFNGNTKGMACRLKVLDEKTSIQLYKSSLHGWLIFYSDGGYKSLGEDLGLSYEEILKVLENPTEEQIEKHRSYPKTFSDMLLPFDLQMFIKLAMLKGIYGELMFRFTTIEERLKWLETSNSKLDNKIPKDLLFHIGLDGVYKLREFLLSE